MPRISQTEEQKRYASVIRHIDAYKSERYRLYGVTRRRYHISGTSEHSSKAEPLLKRSTQ